VQIVTMVKVNSKYYASTRLKYYMNGKYYATKLLAELLVCIVTE